MKKILNACALILMFAVTACSKPAEHISHLNMVNDLGNPAEVALCDDYLHCASLSRMWPQISLGINKSQPITVSNEAKSVFRVTSRNGEQPVVRCLRVQLDNSAKGFQDIPLSSAQGC